MPFCKHCGNEIWDSDNFCENCGNPVEPKPEVSAEPVTQTTEKTPKKKNRLPLIIILSSVGTVLCAGIIAGMVFVGSKVLTKPTDFSEETTKIEESFESTEATTVPSETTKPETSETTESTLPAPTPTEAPIAKPVINKGTNKGVKVTYAAKKAFKRKKSKIIYQIPKIVISGKNTDAINKKIKKAFPERISNPKKCKGYDLSDVWFSYFISDKVVSVVIECYGVYDEYSQDYVYKPDGSYVFNVSVKTGKQLSDKEMLKLCGVTQNDFFKMVKESYNRIKPDEEFTKKDKKLTLEMVTSEYVHAYIGTNGHLCFIGVIWFDDEDGGYDYHFDAETRKCLDKNAFKY